MNDYTQRRLEEPTGKDLIDPLFNAVWDAIKGWDLEREQGAGYAGATGTDVMTILNAVRPSITQAAAEENARVRGEVEKLRVECKSAKPADEIEEIDERAYLSALSDLLSSLEKEINPKE